MNKKRTENTHSNAPVFAGTKVSIPDRPRVTDPTAPRGTTESLACDDFDAHYHRHRRWTLPLARKLGARDKAEDLFHEALLSLLPHFDIRCHAFGPFLDCRLRSRCRGAYRMEVKRQSRFVPLPDGFEELFPSDLSDNAATDLWVLLHQLIGALAETEHVLLRLYYWEDWSLAEVAKYLGMSVSAVKSLAFRTRRKLRDQLRDHPAWHENLR